MKKYQHQAMALSRLSTIGVLVATGDATEEARQAAIGRWKWHAKTLPLTNAQHVAWHRERGNDGYLNRTQRRKSPGIAVLQHNFGGI